MRFLKNKIRLAEAARKQALNISYNHSQNNTCSPTLKNAATSQKIEEPETEASTPVTQKINQVTSPTLPSNSPKTYDQLNAAKNISINYGKAICSFATSKLAVPYLEPYLTSEKISYDGFLHFIKQAKGSIGGIQSFRTLLIQNQNDEGRVKTYKKLYKMLAEVFIKLFSVNWIIHGKVTHKLVYLKYRHKMLRRIQNPEYFTYVKGRRDDNSFEIRR
jgi:hypothetical protein